jgi:uncharacterized protein YuzE
MKITYDPQADALYIELQPGDVDDTIEITPYIYVDVDANGFPLGFEILFAKKMLGKIDKTMIPIQIDTIEAVPKMVA